VAARSQGRLESYLYRRVESTAGNRLDDLTRWRIGQRNRGGRMSTHRSTAYLHSLNRRVHRYCAFEPITPQFRFVIRMAYACHVQNVPYEITWLRGDDGMMIATQTASGNIPMPKPLPKPPKAKPVSDWKPSVFDAEYRLHAWAEKDKKRRGFVIAHSCGLSLIHPSEDGELGGDGNDIRKNWRITHIASGLGFGLELDFKRAVGALLLAATFGVDWTQDVEALKTNPEFRRAGYSVQAVYSTGHEKNSAKQRLADLERAA
jgi:hypothetical protein